MASLRTLSQSSVFAALLFSLLLSGCQQEIQYETINDAAFIETQTPIVQADVLALIEATQAEDVEALLEWTHPRVIKSMGGRADAYFAMQQLFDEMRELQVSHDVFEQNGKPTF